MRLCSDSQEKIGLVTPSPCGYHCFSLCVWAWKFFGLTFIKEGQSGRFRPHFRFFSLQKQTPKTTLLATRAKIKIRRKGLSIKDFGVAIFISIFFQFCDSRRGVLYIFYSKIDHFTYPKRGGWSSLAHTSKSQNACSSIKITKQPPPAFRCMKNDGERENFSYTTQDKHRQNELLLNNILSTFNHFNCVKSCTQVYCVHTLGLLFPLTHMCMC